jgi:hypothetical protein
VHRDGNVIHQRVEHVAEEGGICPTRGANSFRVDAEGSTRIRYIIREARKRFFRCRKNIFDVHFRDTRVSPALRESHLAFCRC